MSATSPLIIPMSHSIGKPKVETALTCKCSWNFIGRIWAMMLMWRNLNTSEPSRGAIKCCFCCPLPFSQKLITHRNTSTTPTISIRHRRRLTPPLRFAKLQVIIYSFIRTNSLLFAKNYS